MRPAPLVLAASLALGCGNLGKDAKIPGDELGTYHVIGRLETSTCGPGALGSSDLWEFDVKLSRDRGELYWLNGQDVVPGRVAADGVTFGFDTEVVIPVRDAGRGRLGCTVVRRDTAAGTLTVSGAEVPSFAGRMRFGYTARESSDCSELVGVEGGFAFLPCEMSYDLTAVRTRAPE